MGDVVCLELDFKLVVGDGVGGTHYARVVDQSVKFGFASMIELSPRPRMGRFVLTQESTQHPSSQTIILSDPSPKRECSHLVAFPSIWLSPSRPLTETVMRCRLLLHVEQALLS